MARMSLKSPVFNPEAMTDFVTIAGATVDDQVRELAGRLAERAITRLVLRGGSEELQVVARSVDLPGLLVRLVGTHGKVEVLGPCGSVLSCVSADGVRVLPE